MLLHDASRNIYRRCSAGASRSRIAAKDHVLASSRRNSAGRNKRTHPRAWLECEGLEVFSWHRPYRSWSCSLSIRDRGYVHCLFALTFRAKSNSGNIAQRFSQRLNFIGGITEQARMMIGRFGPELINDIDHLLHPSAWLVSVSAISLPQPGHSNIGSAFSRSGAFRDGRSLQSHGTRQASSWFAAMTDAQNPLCSYGLSSSSSLPHSLNGSRPWPPHSTQVPPHPSTPRPLHSPHLGLVSAMIALY